MQRPASPSLDRRSVLTALAGVAAGCTGSPAGDGTTTTDTDTDTDANTSTNSNADDDAVKIAVPAAVSDRADALSDLFYEAGLSADVPVELVTPGANLEPLDGIYRQILSRDDPEFDLFLMEPEWLAAFARRDEVADLTTVLPSTTLDRVDATSAHGMVRYATLGSDALYGVPVSVFVPTMQYRADLVREAGFDPSDWATTPQPWEHVAEAAATTRDATDTEYGLTTQLDRYVGLGCCTFYEAVTSWGGAYFGGRDHRFDPPGERPVTIDERPAVDALRMCRALLYAADDHALDGYQQCIPPAALEWVEEDSRKPMAEGDAVFHRNWPYALALNTNADDVPYDPADYGAMPMPYAVSPDEASVPGSGGSPASLGGYLFGMNPDAGSPEGAAEVLRVATTDAFRLGMLEIADWLPVAPDLYAADAVRDPERAGAVARYADTLRYAVERATPRPVAVPWSEEVGTIADHVHGSLARERAPKAALDALAAALRETENGVD